LITLIFWALFAGTALATVSCLGSALSLWRHFRSRPGPEELQAEPGPGLSVIVPIKGADEYTATHLGRLVQSKVSCPTEYLFAMESEADPAYAPSHRVQLECPDRDVRIVITGAPDRLMGKQHNLAGALPQARYPVIGSMDADVSVEPTTLALGLSYLSRPGSGAAYFLPQYYGPGPLGGDLVTLYTHYYYNANMGSLAVVGNAPFVIGALWLIERSTLERTGGFAQFGQHIADDAVIGRAVQRLGLRNVLVSGTVHMPPENLDLRGGFRHLRKWLGMLRAEGLPTYVAIWFMWHPVLWSVVTALLGLPAGPVYLRLGIGLVAAAVVVRLLQCALLDGGVYRQPILRSAPALLAYELLAVPVLFGAGLSARSVIWKGRRYHLGKGGQIDKIEEL